MKKILLIISLLFVTLFLFANPITNVRAMQEGKKIVILYDLSEDTYVSQITMEVDGQSRVIPNKCLYGDINKDLIAGVNKRVEYDVLADYVDGFKNENVVFMVQISKYEAVDLGLSVKWASCNVGASKPEEYGDYFAWGEVEPKKYYEWCTYKYCNGTNKTMTKYCTNSSYGNNRFTDNKIILESEDDVATINCGDAWRMPTKLECDELMEKCNWIWTRENKVGGYKVIGPNGNFIFLPAAGRMFGNSFEDIGFYGFYWSSSLDFDYPSTACVMKLDAIKVYNFVSGRYNGYSIRLVCK